MRSAGITVAGGHENGPGPSLPTGGDVDLDAVRARREAEAAARAAKNPFAHRTPAERDAAAKAMRTAEHRPDYEAVAFAERRHTPDAVDYSPDVVVRPRRAGKSTEQTVTTAAEPSPPATAPKPRPPVAPPSPTRRAATKAADDEQAETQRKIRERQVKALWEAPEELTADEIGKRLNLSSRKVRMIVKDLGLPSRKPGPKPAPHPPTTPTQVANALANRPATATTPPTHPQPTPTIALPAATRDDLARTQTAALAAPLDAGDVDAVGEFLGALEDALLAVDELRDAVLADATRRMRALADHARADIALVRRGMS